MCRVTKNQLKFQDVSRFVKPYLSSLLFFVFFFLRNASLQGTFESAEEGWVYNGQWLQNRMRLGWQPQLSRCSPKKVLIFDSCWLAHPRNGRGKARDFFEASAIGAEPIMPSAYNGRNGRNLVLFVSELSELSSNYHVSHCVSQVKWPNGIEYDGEWKADSALGSRSRWE